MLADPLQAGEAPEGSAGIFAVGLLIAVVVFPVRVKPTEPALAAQSAGETELALATELDGAAGTAVAGQAPRVELPV